MARVRVCLMKRTVNGQQETEKEKKKLVKYNDRLYSILWNYNYTQKYSRLRCLLRVKSLVFCFYLGWSGSILQFRQNIIKVGSKSWLLTCISNITSYTGSALKRELNFCNGYLSLYFWAYPTTTRWC